MYKVLVVDDESFIRKGIVNSLDWKSLGCEVIGTACNGVEAIDIMRKTKADIVISDINMDKMTGVELVEQLNYSYPETKCILLTGIYEFDNVYNAIKFDVVDLILKPTSTLAIQKSLTKAIYQIENEKSQSVLIEKIKEQNVQNIRLKQSILLSGLINNNYNDVESVDVSLSNTKIPLENYLFVCIIPSIYDNENNASLAFFETEKIIAGYIELAFEDVDYYCSFSDSQTIYIYINAREKSDGFISMVKSMCIEMNKMIDNLTDFYCSIGVSDVFYGSCELQKAAKQSLSAANYSIYDENISSVFQYQDIPKLPLNTITSIRTYINKLTDSIYLTSSNAPVVILNELFDFLDDNKVPFNEAKNIYLMIANFCTYQSWVSKSDKANDLAYSNNQYANDLSDCKRAEEAKDILRYIIASSTSEVSYNKNSTVNIISKVESFILANYAKELSLDMISEEFHISPSYLSRLFKSKTGKNVTNYIQIARIEQAKKLIVSTDLRTYEIAEAVGIPDPVYFSKIFKKYTGMRVRDFRGD